MLFSSTSSLAMRSAVRFALCPMVEAPICPDGLIGRIYEGHPLGMSPLCGLVLKGNAVGMVLFCQSAIGGPDFFFRGFGEKLEYSVTKGCI